MSEIQQTLSELLRPFLEEGQTMIDAETPISTLGLESVVVMEFITEVEDHFDINIELESLAHIHTLNDLAAAVGAQGAS
ncbi:MAG: acyl carrier protein [Pseudomonadota bacterium]